MWPFGKSIADRVKDELKKNPVMSGFGLQVSEQGGIVYFAGEVPSERFLNLLPMFADGIHGVKGVNTDGVTYPPEVPEVTAAELEVKAQQVVDGSALAKAVYKAFKGNRELVDDPIDVLQSGAGVVLRGAVDSQHEHNLAVQIAQGTSGVNSVDYTDLKIVEGAKEKAKAEVAAAGGGAPAKPGYVNVPDEWHVVEAGDTLTGIALKYYGDADKYKDIARANNIANPDLIRVGQKIQIPR